MRNKNEIVVKGARLHNLKNVSVKIPKNKIVVVTGVSGSGKSTLIYDTIYAEAQRRYVESLSSYARQFLKNRSKPEFDEIKGLSPAIALETKTNINNPRSTVGTTTEIYHFITLLYERLGKVISPISKKEVTPISFNEFKKFIFKLKHKTKFVICCRIPSNRLKYFIEEGYSRIILNKKIVETSTIKTDIQDCLLVIDRLVYNPTKEFDFILRESYNKALEIGVGEFSIYTEKVDFITNFNNKMILDGIQFEKPHKDLLNFNNPYGACPKCNGHGDLLDIDEEKVIPNKQLSVFDGAIHPWKSSGMDKWKRGLLNELIKEDFPIHKKYIDLSINEKTRIWKGGKNLTSIYDFFEFLKRKSYKIQYRVMLSRYRGLSKCNYCNGNRLNPVSQYISVNNKTIGDIINMSMMELLQFINTINGPRNEKKLIQQIINEILSRLNTLIKLGLDYLTLNRKSSSLSGGESQRINIAKAIGSVLVGTIYILDEPSIGLHSRDTNKLLEILKTLKSLGNSILIVEHDKDIIKAADYLIDMGPLAGINGGEIIYKGGLITQKNSSLTLQYINKNIKISNNFKKRIPKNFIQIKGINKNNLKNVDVSIPIGVFVAITGVSGSGKSTLIKDVLLPAIKRKLKDYSFKHAPCEGIDLGLYQDIEGIEFVDQNSIKKSSKSTPITYINCFDNIRTLFAIQKDAKHNNLTAKHFSFNVNGGRCEDCKGQGYIIVEMQFLSDIKIKCEKCNGKRYQDLILKVKYNNKNIDELLNSTIEESYDFFIKNKETSITKNMAPLLSVGLGYLKLGQTINTLSSGELQRLKLASFLNRKYKNNILIFDEPTKGLHFHDIKILLKAFQSLVDAGNTLIVIEHNLDIIKNVDWVVDLGPEGGEKGGNVVFNGSPTDLAKEDSHTGLALKKELKC